MGWGSKYKNYVNCTLLLKFLLTFPIAKRPLSKIRITPSVRNASPKVTRPRPISG